MNEEPYKFRTSNSETYEWSDWAGGAYLAIITTLFERHAYVTDIIVSFDNGMRMQVVRKTKEERTWLDSIVN